MREGARALTELPLSRAFERAVGLSVLIVGDRQEVPTQDEWGTRVQREKKGTVLANLDTDRPSLCAAQNRDNAPSSSICSRQLSARRGEKKKEGEIGISRDLVLDHRKKWSKRLDRSDILFFGSVHVTVSYVYLKDREAPLSSEGEPIILRRSKRERTRDGSVPK